MSTYVVKHHTHDSESFDVVRLHGSVLRACMAVRAFEGESHDIAERVCKHVIDWLENKTEVSSEDIRRICSSKLAIYHPEAAYMYEQEGYIL
jgi:hypothetical protein